MKDLGNHNVYLNEKLDDEARVLKPANLTMPKFIAKVFGDYVKKEKKRHAKQT